MPKSSVSLVGAGSHDTATPDIHTASESYAERFAGATGEWMLRRQASGIGELIAKAAAGQPDRPLRILDLGGGHGQLTGELLEAGHQVFVHGSHEVCFTRLRGEHPTVAGCVASSLWRLPFAGDSFDVVIGVRLMAHVRAWQALIAEMGRVSARWIVVEFARTHPLVERKLGRLVFSLKRRFEDSTRPFYTYDEEAVRRALLEVGYQAHAVDAQFVLPVLLHRLVGLPFASRAAEAGLAKLGAGAASRSPVLLMAERMPLQALRPSPTTPVSTAETERTSASTTPSASW